ncbi:hypothetical protein Tcan_01514 [Toxocara canis]|uniref:Uncharacterized protein n=1 Tax=Toxocara canis TaxID=6265 RepID=A0A0B2V2A3_TOXCA|nr:hypothetical protein Tcan_01514 [Toxocara canis]
MYNATVDDTPIYRLHTRYEIDATALVASYAVRNTSKHNTSISRPSKRGSKAKMRLRTSTTSCRDRRDAAAVSGKSAEEHPRQLVGNPTKRTTRQSSAKGTHVHEAICVCQLISIAKAGHIRNERRYVMKAIDQIMKVHGLEAIYVPKKTF